VTANVHSSQLSDVVTKVKQTEKRTIRPPASPQTGHTSIGKQPGHYQHTRPAAESPLEMCYGSLPLDSSDRRVLVVASINVHLFH
jgi:hypothetical protein